MRTTAPFTNILILAALLFGVLAALTPRASAQGGVPLWTNRYNGPTNWGDSAAGIAVDTGGNVIVTGYSTGSNSGDDFATIKYSNTGELLWIKRYNGPGNIRGPGIGSDDAKAVALDTNDNIFVTGGSEGTNSYFDYATIKYSSTGVALWTNRYNGPGNSSDVPAAIAVDAGGNVLVTGFLSSSTNFHDYATIKYSNAGLPLWTNRYDSPAHWNDEAAALAVDNAGNIFVAGQSYNGSNYDYGTLLYSSAGIPLWTNRYNGQANGDDYALAGVVDNNGNFLVTGYSFVGPFSSSYEYLTIKYSADGTAIWTNRYKGTSVIGGSAARAIAVDSNDNVFVTGSARATNEYSVYDRSEFATVAYSTTGVPLWTNRYHGALNGDTAASAIVVDDGGNVFVTGTSYGDGGDFDYATVAYSGSGVAIWTNRYNGLWNDDDDPVALVADRIGNVFITGRAHETDGYYYDYTTIKYSAISPSIPLDFLLLNDELVLIWADGRFSLQTALTSTGVFANVPGATSPYTNSLTATQQFFRLKRN